MAVVDSITFDVEVGEIFAFLGPNGAGKTTTVEILECIRTPTSGSAKVLGYDISKSSEIREIKKRIGVLLQDFSTFKNLTVKETLQFFAGLYGKPVDTKVLESLELIERFNQKFDLLSGGLKQRVGIASALVNDPELVFLDEPTTGLDPKSRRMTCEFIKSLKKLGKTVFLTSHYMEEAQYLADRIGIINKGKIVALDTPKDLTEKFGGLVVHKGDKELAESLKRWFPEVRITSEGKIIIYIHDGKELLSAINTAATLRLEQEIEVLTPTIEEVFLNIVGMKLSEGGL